MSNIFLQRFAVNKLVRDHIPDILKKLDILTEYRTLPAEEYQCALKAKLTEESYELGKTTNKQELLEELADILEIFYAIKDSYNLTIHEIEEERLKKRASKGGFDKRIYNSFVEIDETNPAINYYLAKAGQYPKVNCHSYPNCLFCKIVHGENQIVKKFKHCYAIRDQFPVSQGHTLIIPYDHIEQWFEAPNDVQLNIIEALNSIKIDLDQEFNPDAYNIGANCGKAAGQTVMHLHIHLIPRYHGDMEDPRGGVRGVIPSMQTY